MNNKIIRTVCYFTDKPSTQTLKTADDLSQKLTQKGFTVQTKRICSPNTEEVFKLDKTHGEKYYFSVGTLTPGQVNENLDTILKAKNIAFNTELSQKDIDISDANLLFKIISTNASKTFNFSYVFNNKPSTPFFPSASYKNEGFAIGLQPTDLSEGCQSLDEWFAKMKQTWDEITSLFKEDDNFLGIDSSIAPLFTDKSSLVHFINKLSGNFSKSTTTDTYLQITSFIKSENPKPVGLCGLMFPCLEDFDLADEYEKGNFSIERNVYLSLHSGLGIDTYPIGTDEKTERVLEILKLIRRLSNKYQKPLSARFVSDGKAKIGEKTNFENQYLKDIVVKIL